MRRTRWSIAIVVLLGMFEHSFGAGRLHAVAFLANMFPDRGICDLLLSSDVDGVTVTVTSPGGQTQTLTLNKGDSESMTFDPASYRLTRGLHHKGLIIESNGDITVHGVNALERSGDTFLAVPVTKHSKEFIVSCYSGLSQYTIVSPLDDIQVEIYIKTEVGYILETSTTLGKHDTYTVTKQNCTGDYIKTSKPAAVYSGHPCGFVPLMMDFCDHAVIGVLPLTSLGTNHYLPPIGYRSKNTGYITRIVAGLNPIQVNASGCGSEWLEAGEFWELDVTQLKTILHVSCSDKCQVVQFNKGKMADGMLFDPFMVSIIPESAFQESMTFYTAKCDVTRYYYNFLSIIVPAGQETGVILDGGPLSPSVVWYTYSDQKYRFGGFPLLLGKHTISHQTPGIKMAAYVHGHGRTFPTATGYPVGMRVTDEPWSPAGESQAFSSTSWGTSSPKLTVDGDSSTCHMTGLETHSWVIARLPDVYNITSVSVLGQYAGKLTIRISNVVPERIGHVAPCVESSVYCGNMRIAPLGVSNRKVTCLNPGEGSVISVIGNTESSEQMKICELTIN